MTTPSLKAPTSEAPEAEVARDLARRGLLVTPFVLVVVWLTLGGESALSVGYGIAIVLANLLLSAYLLRWAARISLGLVASVSLGGYVARLALVFAAVWMVKDEPWVRLVPLGIAIVVAHLGLLVWELRYVSASFAHPGLKPSASRPAAGYRRRWQQQQDRRRRQNQPGRSELAN